MNLGSCLFTSTSLQQFLYFLSTILIWQTCLGHPLLSPPEVSLKYIWNQNLGKQSNGQTHHCQQVATGYTDSATNWSDKHGASSRGVVLAHKHWVSVLSRGGQLVGLLLTSTALNGLSWHLATLCLDLAQLSLFLAFLTSAISQHLVVSNYHLHKWPSLPPDREQGKYRGLLYLSLCLPGVSLGQHTVLIPPSHRHILRAYCMLTLQNANIS